MKPRTGLCAFVRTGAPVLVLAIAATGSSGCSAVSHDVRDYYQQMAYNYKQAREKAHLDEMSVESKAKVELATGDMNHYRRSQRELGKLKSWEEKCAKQEERFEKAARWTEDHFKIERGGPGYNSMGSDATSGLALEPPPQAGPGAAAEPRLPQAPAAP